MDDMYKDVFDSIAKALNTISNMVIDLAKQTLSVNEYTEFFEKYADKKDNDALTQKGR